ncbi:MAG: ABC transporter ATP-binding protein [Myxococcota bacterium]
MIELQGVEKNFRLGEREVSALRGIDLSISEGEFIALVGPSGSGKTTCLEILGCISLPSRGCYQLDGRSVAGLDDYALADLRARSIGFVFQTFNLLPRISAARNVALPLLYAGVPRREREAIAVELLSRVGLDHRCTHRPGQLSGGEQQRVAIARALVNDPRVILADEPTGNLDQENGHKILDLLGEVHAQGRTLVVVTHDEEVAACADRTVRIRDGRIVEDTAAT